MERKWKYVCNKINLTHPQLVLSYTVKFAQIHYSIMSSCWSCKRWRESHATQIVQTSHCCFIRIPFTILKVNTCVQNKATDGRFSNAEKQEICFIIWGIWPYYACKYSERAVYMHTNDPFSKSKRMSENNWRTDMWVICMTAWNTKTENDTRIDDRKSKIFFCYTN